MGQRFQIDHPTDDAALPSFVHPTLADLEDDLGMVFDAWNCLRGAKESYLPPEEEEPKDAYGARLDRAVWTDFFTAAIKGFAGVMTRFEVKNPPPSMELAMGNIDRQGNSLHAFFLQADQLIMRDAGVPILVEMPEERPSNQAQQLALPEQRPYLVMHPRRMLLNWRVDRHLGEERVRKAVLLEWAEADAGGPEGFGVEYEPRYRILEPGRWRLVKIETEGRKKPEIVEVDNGFYLNHKGAPLEYVPLIWYPPSRQPFGEGELAMLHLAHLNLQHFRKNSDYEEKDHRVNMPVPVEKGGIPPQPGQKAATEAIGPNTLRRVSENGDFFFAEPNASSLRETRAGIELVEARMREHSLSFLHGNQATKTATQAGLEAGSTQASLSTLKQQKENVIQQVMKIWCDYTGEKLHSEAGITMSTAMFDLPMTPQAQDGLVKLVEGRLMSKLTAIEELQRAGVNRTTHSAKKELERIAQELQEELEAARNAMAVAGAAPGQQPEEDDTLPSSGDQGSRRPGGQGQSAMPQGPGAGGAGRPGEQGGGAEPATGG